jgi:hypothetical protein
MQRKMLFGSAAIGLAGLSMAALAGLALGQTAKEDSVVGRPRPDYDPIGVSLGSTSPFVLFPSLKVAGGFDDNVFRAERHRRSSVFTKLHPEFTLNSDWEEDSAQIGASGDIARFASESGGNYEDATVFGNGKLAITDELSANASARFSRLHEDRADADVLPGSNNITVYNKVSEAIGLDYAPAPTILKLSGEANQYHYFNNKGQNNADRDYNEYIARIRGGAEVATDLVAFIEPSYNIRTYDQHRDDNGFIRDSHGYDVRTGLSYDVTGVTNAEVSAGYFHQSYEDRHFASISGFSLGAQVLTNPTDDLTITTRADRSIQETPIQGVSGIVETKTMIKLDYEVADDLVGNLGLGYENDDFHGSTRNDNLYRASLGTTYYLNSYLSTGLEYEYSQRNSNASDSDFKDNLVMLRLVGQL